MKKSQKHTEEIFKRKSTNIIENNSGFQTIKIIRDILIGKNQKGSLDIEIILSGIENINYTPITYVDVKRYFGQYKSILRSNCRSFFIRKHSTICYF